MNALAAEYHTTTPENGSFPHHLGCQGSKAVDTFAEVGRPRRRQHAHAGRDGDHASIPPPVRHAAPTGAGPRPCWPARASRRHPNTCCELRCHFRAISDTIVSGAGASATIRPLSSADQRRLITASPTSPHSSEVHPTSTGTLQSRAPKSAHNPPCRHPCRPAWGRHPAPGFCRSCPAPVTAAACQVIRSGNGRWSASMSTCPKSRWRPHPVYFQVSAACPHSRHSGGS